VWAHEELVLSRHTTRTVFVVIAVVVVTMLVLSLIPFGLK
jgi:hypothetical protein